MLSLYRTFLVAFGIIGVPLGSLGFMHSDNSKLRFIGLIIVIIGALAILFVIKSFFSNSGCLSFIFLSILILFGGKFVMSMLGSDIGIPNFQSNLNKGVDRLVAKSTQYQRGTLTVPGVKKESRELLREENVKTIASPLQNSEISRSIGKQEQKPQFIKGTATAITGDIIRINDYYIRLFGIDAPEKEQTCADQAGRAYNCGLTSKENLENILRGETIICRIIEMHENKIIGTCLRGEYDVGAQQIMNGWALAYLEYSDVYVPYENEARSNLKGLWSGSFYAPWDYRKNQK